MPGRSRPPATATSEPTVLVRISAQRYNELADYERLAAALPATDSGGGDPVDRAGAPVADEHEPRRALTATGDGLVSPVRNGSTVPV